MMNEYVIVLAAILSLAVVAVAALIYSCYIYVRNEKERERLVDRIQSDSLYSYKSVQDLGKTEAVRMNDELEAEYEENRM
jgi:uncharacterized membrane protein YukC